MSNKNKKLKKRGINTKFIGKSNKPNVKILKNSVYGMMGPNSCFEHVDHNVTIDSYEEKYKNAPCNKPSKDDTCFNDFEGDVMCICKIRK